MRQLTGIETKKKNTSSPQRNYDGGWDALGKTFKRKGQAEAFIRKSGLAVGKPIYYGTRWYL